MLTKLIFLAGPHNTTAAQQAFVAKTVLGIPGSCVQWGRGSGENSVGYDMNGCPLTPGGAAMNAVEDILNTVNAAMAARGMINAFNGMRSVINQGTKAAASEVWGLPSTARGRVIEEAFGGNLAGNYPVIDKFVDGVATSIKSIDLNASTYQSASALKNKIVDYIDKLIEFQGRRWADRVIEASDISTKELLLVIPRNATAAQQAVINETVRYGSSNGILVTVRIMP